MEFELKDYIRILRKRIWLITAFVVVVSMFTAMASYLWLTPVYQASTKLIVNKTNENVAVAQLDINTVNMNIRLIDTYKEIIKTPAIMDKVVKEHPELGLTSAQLTSQVSVSSVNNTQVMTVSVQDPSYRKATEIVNAISLVFVQEIPQIMKVDNVSLLAPADPNKAAAPIKPRPALNTAIAFIVSLMIAVGITFLLEYLDDTIRSEEDVQQHLGIPTIAMIPRLKDEETKSYATNVTVIRGGEKNVKAHS
ncbi:lipopolysaccharide biosynthesis protein [Cohnella kolymensis]|uniref:Lipopolysaccharide biosynthesis protein n=1 Tax=Cohnella kolymensis TaxID=1590652 RepID=A0ABR5A303_9BACL|nr:Wzz/FepE/Etk N-terminal domain-containing protein [Cohnella kolymensis]KIL35444.1 lipopolysaccharide biosynthesis protein [Cohnella kolymensis]